MRHDPNLPPDSKFRSLSFDLASDHSRIRDERLPLVGVVLAAAVGVAVLDVGDVPLNLVHGSHLPHLDAARLLPVSQLGVHDLDNNKTCFSRQDVRPIGGGVGCRLSCDFHWNPKNQSLIFYISKCA